MFLIEVDIQPNHDGETIKAKEKIVIENGQVFADGISVAVIYGTKCRVNILKGRAISQDPMIIIP
jgi:hypothetical protein